MPTHSAIPRHGVPPLRDEYRAKTAAANPHSSSLYNDTNRRALTNACNKVATRKLTRVQQPIELNYNDMLHVVGMQQQCQKSAPNKKVRLYATVLPRREYERIQEATKVLTLEEKLQRVQEEDCVARIAQEESEKRKQFLKEIDEAHMKARMDRDKAMGVGKSDLFAEEKVQILEKAFIAKHEQEEEVKRANRIILNAKCHVIREAQIQEKQELAKEQRKEEIRLEKVMNDIAKKSLSLDDQAVIKDQENKLKYATEIKKQLRERENLRYLEAERIEEEAKMMAKANEAIKRDEERKAQYDHERRMTLRSELKRISDMSAFFKKCIFEQEREAEMRIQQYMKEKAERERKLALEQKLAKEALERKRQLIFLLQQKRMESKTELEEMALTREQENIEREYRRKEKEAALRKKQLEKELAQARENQLNELKHRQALQLARNEEDFKRVVDHLKRAEERQNNIDRQRRECRGKYRSEIINQMNQKEMERRQMETRAKNEQMAFKEREKRREANIRAVIQSKLHAMRDANLPEKYIRDVEKQLLKISEIQ